MRVLSQTAPVGESSARASFFRRRPASAPGGKPREPIATASDQVKTNLLAHALSAALTGCLILSPLGAVTGGFALYQVINTPASDRPVEVVDRANERAIAEEIAKTVVVTWLTTTKDNPERLTALVKGAGVTSMPKQAFVVADPSIAGITEVNQDTWSVVVAATVTDASQTTGRKFYQVPVQVVGGGGSALTLPAVVAGPSVAASSSINYPHMVTRQSGAGLAVEQFLAAYVAGQGDLNRYLSPGVVLQPISPAPFTSVQLVDLRSTTEISEKEDPKDGDVSRVLAVAAASVSEEQTVHLSYALTLNARAGRWEVAALDPIPALGRSTASAAPAPTTAPRTPVTPTGAPTSNP